MNIRYSAIETFLKCPKEYYEKYVLGIKDHTESIPLLYGTGVHLALQTHFEGGDPYSVFDMYWGSVKDKNLEYGRDSWEYLNSVTREKFLPNFIRLHAKKFESPKLEETLEYPLMDDVTMQGTWDICGMYEGKLTMVDYKTSAKEYYPSKIHRNPQLYIYSWLYRQKYGVLPEQIMYKVFVKSEGRIQTLKHQLTEDNLNAMMSNVRAVVSHMTKLDSKNLYCNYNNPFCSHKEC